MARDLIHEAIARALINDGWTITDDPFQIISMENGRYLEADLGVEKFIRAKKGVKKIIVEIKTFSGASVINQFYTTLGQYLVYRTAMKDAEIERALYLAISKSTSDKFEKYGIIRKIIQEFGLKLIVVRLEKNKIIKWID